MQATLTKIKKGMNFLLSRIAAVLLSAMTLLVLYQVFTRYVLNSPAAFTEEIVRYLLIWIYRCSLCVQYKTAYGIGTCKRQVVSKSKESTDDSD